LSDSESSAAGVGATGPGDQPGGVTIDGDVSGQVAVGDTVIQVQDGRGSDPSPVSVTVLFWAANPTDTPSLRLDEEVRTIDERLRATAYRDRIVLQQQWALRIGDLSEGLLRYRPGVVHFSGHGSPAGQLMLMTPKGTSETVPSDALAGLFAAVATSARGSGLTCVVFNACYSASQAAAVAQHVPCVVGTTKAIGDDAAIRFAGGFYRALGYGESIQTAFDLGRNEIALHDLGEELTPQLHVRSGVDARALTIV
jgi:hypothetical protein